MATITGTSGTDYLSGRRGEADHLFGLGGNDMLTSNADGIGDILEGGEGDDYYLLWNSRLDTIIDSGGEDSIFATIAIDLRDHPDIENAEQLFEWGGRPTHGNAGDNTLYDRGGGNALFGHEGSDRLIARGGDDILNGGTGHDFLDGGAGRDRFDFTSIADSPAGAGERDIISGFELGEDTLNFGRIDADTSHTGNQAFAFIRDAAFTGEAGLLRYELGIADDGFSAMTLVSGDVDGDGAADFEVQIWGHHALLPADFIL
ncbi:MAG: hypothetical protein ACO1OG_04285 [Devosia sp.]